MFHGVI